MKGMKGGSERGVKKGKRKDETKKMGVKDTMGGKRRKTKGGKESH